MSPLVYNNLGYGERKIINVFLNKEIEDKNKEIDAMNKQNT